MINIGKEFYEILTKDLQDFREWEDLTANEKHQFTGKAYTLLILLNSLKE